MKKILALFGLALIAYGYVMYETGASGAPMRETAPESVRQMAAFLEAAPTPVVAHLEGNSSASRVPASVAPVPGAIASAGDATQAGLAEVRGRERAIASHYPDSEAGARIRRFVALVLSDVDSDVAPDTNRSRVMNDLMKDAVATGSALEEALSMIPADEVAERSAVLKLVTHLGTSDSMLPTVDNILLGEISRRPASDLGEAQTMFNQLIDSYTMLFSDVRKQAAFVRAGIQAQDDPRLRDALQERLDLMQKLASSSG